MWLFKDIIVVVGLVIMAIIFVINTFGKAFDIQQINENIVYWGLTWSELLFFILVFAFWMVVIKLILRINKYRKAMGKDEDHVEIEIVRICPQGLSISVEFTLHVNNVPMQLASIDLIRDNEPTPCSHMPTHRILDNVETYTVEFPTDMNTAVKTAKYESNQVSWSGALRILAGGKPWKTKEFVLSSAPCQSISHNEDSQTG